LPGLFGIARREPDDTLTAAFDRLSSFSAVSGKIRSEVRVDRDNHWAVGRAHHGFLQAAPQLADDGDVQVLFHGDLDNCADLNDDGPSRVGRPRDAASSLRALYAHHGVGAAARLEGSHCAAIVNGKSRTLTLIADRLGSYPLYWAKTGAGFVFASELRAVLRSGEVPRSLDAAAVADCLTFGFPMGTKTLARGIELVPPGSALTYCWQSGDLDVRQYASVADNFVPRTGTKHEFFDEITDSFRRAVERGFSGEHAYGLALSGGLDSRAILSAVNGRASALTTYTLGVDGCADQVIAERLSSLTGTKHTFFELDNGYLNDFLPNLERMVSLTDGMYLSHGLTEMLALKFLADTGIEVLLRGHGGELAKTSTAWPFHTDARVHAMRDRRELTPYLLQRINYIRGDVDFHSLFTPQWAQEMIDRPRTSLQESIEHVELTPPNLCTYLYITEHHRRSSIPSLELFRTALDVRLPFFDARFMALLLGAPAEWRDGVEIHRALMSRSNARLLKVRNSNTGAPGDASPLVEMALDKLNTVLKRLNVYGYRHYHQFDAWMQAQLLNHVEAVVLERRALQRGIFREDALRRLIDETRTGAKDRSFLLLVLLIVELWQRQNLS
jgi:asparagine synthase (glutamine-hydrolysing)